MTRRAWRDRYRAYAYNIRQRASSQIAEHCQKREPMQALAREVYPVTRSERRMQQSIILFKTDRSLACHVPLCFAYVLLLAYSFTLPQMSLQPYVLSNRYHPLHINIQKAILQKYADDSRLHNT